MAVLEQLQQQFTELEQQHQQLATYHQQIRLVFTKQRKLFRKVRKLAPFKEPVVFLERVDGTVETYEGVKGKEFSVPRLPHGIEKTIYLGYTPPKRVPYGDGTFHAYFCHEDYAFPNDWRYNIVRVKNNKKEGEEEALGVSLAAANVNSEALQDIKRKVLIAWEKMALSEKSKLWAEYGKVILIVAGAILAGLYLWNQFGGGGGNAEPAVAAAQAVSNASGITTIG